MSSHALLLIVISAVMHALWNLLVKRSRDKTVFIWWMFVTSGSLLSCTLPAAGPFPPIGPRLAALVVSGSACFVLYHLFNGRAYRAGGLSLTYPLSQTSMLWVPLWGVLILGERFTPAGLGGIALIGAGVWCIQLRALSWREIVRPLQSFGQPGVREALAAGFIYSIGSIIDKTGVTAYDPFHFTYLLVLCMLLMMSLNLARPRYRGRILEEWRHNRLLILCSGPVMLASFMTFRYGLQLAPVSYAVPVRQVSLLVGVLIGSLFLHEECGRIRFTAALLILAGAALIRLG